jgi:N-acetylmuramoyl-L-alanine amidase
VLNAPRILIILLVVTTGCKTASRPEEKQRPPDWEITPQAPPTSPVEPARAPEPEATWTSLARWSSPNGLEAPRELKFSSVSTFSFSYSNGVLVVQPRSLQASWNGLQFWLGFPPQLIDGEIYLHSLDLKKNLEPLLHNDNAVNKSNRLIVIDPGHGGGNTGTQSAVDGRFEKEFTLDWAQRLAPLLEARGWTVLLTRTNDSEVPLSDRVTFAEENKANFFLSLHFNASPNGPQRVGLETYILTPVGMPSSLTREFDDDPELVFTNNAFDAQNLQYAIKLHRALLESTELADRGVRRARFMGVLRGQNRPAVLLEGGYLSNPEEAKRVADPEYRQRLAEAVALALE